MEEKFRVAYEHASSGVGVSKREEVWEVQAMTPSR